jgi:hypothetical protein
MKALIGTESDFCSRFIRCTHRIDPATIVDWVIIHEVYLELEGRGDQRM